MKTRDPLIEYRPIAGFPGYEVGADGSVWSLLRKGPQAKESRIGTRWRRLKPGVTKRGYLLLTLCVDGKRYTRWVHQLVLEAFLGPRPEGCVARHCPDRNPSNCAITNLKWGTHKENADDRGRDGNHQIGEKNCQSRLTAGDVRLMRLSKEPIGVLAEKYGISRQSVWHIKKRDTWRHVL